MKKVSSLGFLCFLFLCHVVIGQTETNKFPPSGNVGIGTTTPGVPLHIKPVGSLPTWIGLDKNAGMETGIQFLKYGSVLFYLYSDNEDDDGLKIQSAGVGGESDGYPRIFIPYNTKDLYFGLSGGSIAVGHRNPYSSSRLHLKATINTPWSIISESASNDRIIGLSHDGAKGLISTSYLGNSGFSPLHFQTSNLPRLAITVDGNIGIGTTTPMSKLQVSGGEISLDEDQPLRGGGRWLISGNSSRVTIGTSNPGIGLRFDAGSPNRMFIDGTTGNVGIATTSPSEALTVNGTVYSKEVKVDLSVPGPDYVFDKEYDLPSLEELEAYIDQYKHLPEVPSAKEMQDEGINLGTMNMILLKKIEELTLYMIQLKKENEEIKKKLKMD